MKQIKLMLFAVAIACTFLSCTKSGEDGGSDCEDDNTTKVTFINNGTIPLRVQVAVQLTPQYQAIDPVVNLDLAPGASVVKEIPADQYFIVWWRDCATTCNKITSYSKTYEACSTNEEKQGI